MYLFCVAWPHVVYPQWRCEHVLSLLTLGFALNALTQVPILSINFGQLALAKPSQATLDKAAERNRIKSGIVLPPTAAPPSTEASTSTDHATPPRKRKRKGVNPLACKKKKPKAGTGSGKVEGKGSSENTKKAGSKTASQPGSDNATATTSSPPSAPSKKKKKVKSMQT
eukprot:m.103586 g.103586  ORF g.103586 m.103586 type:complete len:169 (+) comp10485_c0_seq2:89-595(+)